MNTITPELVGEVESARTIVARPPALTRSDAAPSASPLPRADGLIEIVLTGGVLVRVDAQVDGRALRRVLGALAER